MNGHPALRQAQGERLVISTNVNTHARSQTISNAQTASSTPDRGITQTEIDQQVFDLYDEYCHGRIDRREFLARAAALTIVGGLGMAQALLPRYAQAQTISFTDERIKASYVTYPSPGGNSGTTVCTIVIRPAAAIRRMFGMWAAWSGVLWPRAGTG